MVEKYAENTRLEYMDWDFSGNNFSDDDNLDKFAILLECSPNLRILNVGNTKYGLLINLNHFVD